MSESRNFEEASRQIRENLNRHISKFDNILDGEEESDEDCPVSDKIVDELLSYYSNTDKEFVASARKNLRASSASSCCLICIESIRKADPIWNCGTCYISLHLNCVAKWSKDSIFMIKQQQEEEPEKNLSLGWSCPNCRTSYTPKDVPSKYFCYCTKEIDPKFDPWLQPHSCGEKCGKTLKPECKHKCVLLCHPGACPPCPHMVSVTCYCAKSTPSVKRCSASNWSCNAICGATLACKSHTCPEVCHPGPCPPCSRSSTQSCCCGKEAKPLSCSAPTWKCGNKCGKLLACAHHVCDYICHDKGDCPPCPLSLIRHCPCGKSDYKLPCTQATPTCGDTCGKLLSCGSHYCAERCHRGNCPSCLQMVKKTCRCGNKTKEVQCSKQFNCDIKCKRIRDCRKHPCNKKCCTGDCAPCEQMCGKMLNCKNHKCLSRCHQGPCFPCTKQCEITCNCGATKIKVPCGKEKNTKPPKCKKLCTKKSNCHHPDQDNHYCHKGKCPTCKKICRIKGDCGHRCPSKCHDNVPVKVEKARPIGPWEDYAPEFVIKKLPCPPCPEPVPVPCLGQHEVIDRPCHDSKVVSCGRLCGRRLSCTNHTCDRTCHRVRQAVDNISAGINCKKCSADCSLPRPEGCSHPCNLGCHPGECKPCEVNLKLKCHCGLNNIFLKCGSLIGISEEERNTLLSCKDQCPKLIECGHRCSNMCHAGACSSTDNCRKKVKLTCKCKLKKQEFRCHEVYGKRVEDYISCDQKCEEKLKNDEVRGEIKEVEVEDIYAKREAEIFERLMSDERSSKRRRRNRKKEIQVEQEESFYSKNKIYIASFAFLLIVISYYSFQFM